MNVSRGDIVLADFPHATGKQSSRRPVLVVQADHYNHRIDNVVVALITTNLRNASDPAHYLIELSTSEGQQTGLNRDSVVSCINLVTLYDERIGRKIGELSAQGMQRMDDCLKAALGIP